MDAKHAVGIGLVVALMAILGACQVAKKADHGQQVQVEITEANCGQQVELGLGEILVVRLDHDPSSGYGWVVAALDEGMLRHISGPLFGLRYPDNAPPGSGGWVTYRFEAVGQGESELELSLVYPKEELDPYWTYRVQVVVR